MSWLTDFIMGILFLIFGYIIGRTLKFGMKIVIIVIIILLIFYILEILPKDMLSKLSEKAIFLKDIYSKFGMSYRALNFLFLMFAFGLLIGLLLGKS